MTLIKVDVDINDEFLAAKLAKMNDPSVMLQIYNVLAKRCDPYVPFLEGPLSQTVRVTPDGVTYIQPYARYQYYGTEFNHTIDYHPLASAMWDKAMMRDHGDEFAQDVKAIIARYMNDR